MDLSIIIVNYNTFALTKDTINSILRYSYPFTVEIIVVDNNSTDDSLKNLKKYFKGKNVRFIESKENNGFAAGNNQGIKEARRTYVLL